MFDTLYIPTVLYMYSTDPRYQRLYWSIFNMTSMIWTLRHLYCCVMIFVTDKKTYFLNFEGFHRKNFHSLLCSLTGISTCSTKDKTLNEQLDVWFFTKNLSQRKENKTISLWSDGCQVGSLNASFLIHIRRFRILESPLVSSQSARFFATQCKENLLNT